MPRDAVEDDQEFEDPIQAEYADTDETLAQDEGDAMNQSNVIGDRLRHAQPVASTKYHELDEDDLPNEAQ
ncbi:uncharacterized protein N7511_000640 [Penicillium nucicola]|uniref:uncharacterized protein n=1 Tax=Penicillium nucicola TaxID=1850975 RepID=UPI002544E986|nr:uncharacterized protein N7511_000640 [Penicillium nucicola]KAJ5775629.1 hypothetical protein N7511_000640 [Penicillium nucicola]